MAKRKKKPEDRNRILERRLFGPYSCRDGPCDRDGNVCVGMVGYSYPAVRIDGNLHYEKRRKIVPRWFCEEHAQQACER